MNIQYQNLPGQLTDDENFPAVLINLERFVKGIYDDGKHIATIGIGTNVQDVRAYLALTLKELGVFTTKVGETDVQRNTRYIEIINNFNSIIKSHSLERLPDEEAGTSPSERALQAKLDAKLAEYLPGAKFTLEKDQAINIVV